MKAARAAAQRLGDGGGALTRDFGAWLFPGVARTTVSRLVGCGVGGVLAATVVDRAPGLLAVATTAGIVAAWRAGAAAPDEGEVPADEFDHGEVAAAMHELADPHLHLAVLADEFGTDTATVRAVLTEMGVPIAPGVRMRGSGVSTGVRAGDLPPLPRPLSDGAEGVLTSNNNSNNAIVERYGEGMTIIIRDPVETAARRRDL